MIVQAAIFRILPGGKSGDAEYEDLIDIRELGISIEETLRDAEDGTRYELSLEVIDRNVP